MKAGNEIETENTYCVTLVRSLGELRGRECAEGE